MATGLLVLGGAAGAFSLATGYATFAILSSPTNSFSDFYWEKFKGAGLLGLCSVGSLIGSGASFVSSGVYFYKAGVGCVNGARDSLRSLRDCGSSAASYVGSFFRRAPAAPAEIPQSSQALSARVSV